ncbi:Putative rRNA methylase [Natronincola peptidivorans]|uniref:Putative rRNA methylase n=1 Tax=Natronincola peptidivorans TaxID=426128 RepID=A0A1H9YJH1_9FIRM|nr:class I SAM-dependent methyltransferase [Natronincola peptidivorans]SES69148.1 Putative rRNA methylase [Natronincola peptidivorans]
MKYVSFLKATNFVHNLLINRIPEGSTVIDGTMGNGYDTLFLHEQVGEEGVVYAFDIQKLALERTKEMLIENNIAIDSNRIRLIHDGHENIGQYVKEPISVAMFNLGYLPNGDKEIITQNSTTIQALSAALSLLQARGIISIVIYYGHIGGLEEKQRLMDYVNNLNSSEYTVMQCSYLNKEKNPPIIVLIEKNK